jgi:hypothetical protein
VWLVVVVAALLLKASRSEAAQRRARERKLKARIASLAKCPEAEFVANAGECLRQLLDLGALDAEPRIKALAVDDETKSALLDLVTREAESKYSYLTPEIPSREVRDRILEALKKITP